MDTPLILIIVIAVVSAILLIRQKSEDDSRYYDLKTELNNKISKLNSIIEEKQTIQVFYQMYIQVVQIV